MRSDTAIIVNMTRDSALQYLLRSFDGEIGIAITHIVWRREDHIIYTAIWKPASNS